MMNKETKQRLTKLVKAWKEIRSLFGGYDSLNVHGFPVGALDDSWVVEAGYVEETKNTFKYATSKDEDLQGLTLFE